ncbi:MAG: 2OG-Fe dioxygenase family protein [Planctomycetota bacterium]
MIRPLPPPYADPARVDALLGDHGHVALSPQGLAAVLGGGVDADDPLAPLAHYWGDLPVDAHLRDGGHYRRRRHGSYVVQGGEVRTVPHRAHWQPLDYNALHGGLMRWFEPLQDDFAGHAVLHSMLTGLTARASAMRGTGGPWFVEAHAIRITTDGGIGRPTPEGAHRDGVDLVAVVLLDRHGIKGGETRVFEADGPRGERFTMTERGTTLLIDDERTIHESTPIQPLGDDVHGHRDTLVLTWRRDGFQAPD